MCRPPQFRAELSLLVPHAQPKGKTLAPGHGLERRACWKQFHAPLYCGRRRLSTCRRLFTTSACAQLPQASAPRAARQRPRAPPAAAMPASTLGPAIKAARLPVRQSHHAARLLRLAARRRKHARLPARAAREGGAVGRTGYTGSQNAAPARPPAATRLPIPSSRGCSRPCRRAPHPHPQAGAGLPPVNATLCGPPRLGPHGADQGCIGATGRACRLAAFLLMARTIPLDRAPHMKQMGR